MAKLIKFKRSEEIHEFGGSVILIFVLELTVDDILSLLDLSLEFIDEDSTVAITLLTFLHRLDLELCIPVETLDNLVSIKILVEVFILWVVNIEEIDTTWLLYILIGKVTLW